MNLLFPRVGDDLVVGLLSGGGPALGEPWSRSLENLNSIGGLAIGVAKVGSCRFRLHI